MNIVKMVGLEIEMDIKRTFRYKFSIVSDLVIFFVLFSIFMMTDAGSSYADTYGYANYKEMILIGYVAWLYSISAISDVTNNLKSELIHGTFYKKLSSKYPLQTLYVGLFVSAMLMETVVIILVTMLSRTVYGITMSFHPQYIFVLLIGTIGMYGIGLIVAGFGVYYKRIGSVVFLIQTALLFVTNTVPTNEVILRISRLIPLTKSNDILKLIVMGQVYGRNMIQLILISILWLVVGGVIFQMMLNHAKKKGNLLFY